MRYFKLIYDYENDDNYVNCNIGNIGDIDEYITINGKKINEWKKIAFEYNSSEGYILTDFIANLYRWLIVSKKFVNVSNNLIKEQVQYLPVKIIDKIANIENNSYFVANIVTILDALDMKKSKYDIFEVDTNKIISVEKYVLIEDKIVNKHIFRLKNDLIPIFVSEKIKQIIEDNKLLGFAFLEVDVN